MKRHLKMSLLFALGSFIFLAQQAVAESETPKASRSIAGDITLVLVSPDPAHIDRQLLPMKEDLYRAFSPQYQRFEHLQASYPRLVIGNPHSVRLPGGGQMKITYTGQEGEYLQLKLDLPKWKGTIRVKDGKRFFQAGRKLRTGILIISTRMHATH